MRLSLYRLLLIFLTAGALALAGCTDDGAETDETPDADMPAVQPAMTATAQLEPTEGNEASGRVSFRAEEGGVHVIADVRNLSEGLHGFHIHENGDCSNQAEAAGGHFAPAGDPHGAPTDPPGQHHTGDMGNIRADANGTARLDTTFSFLALEGDTSIVGKAVIVHQGEDDLTSQPSGDAGPRVACGVIQMEGAAQDTTGTAASQNPSPSETY